VGTADDVMSHPDVEAVGYVEVTGTEATMIIPDPNLFTGEVKITRAPAPAALDEDPEAAGSVRSPWWPRTSTPSQRRSRSLLNNGVAGAGLAFWGGRNAAKAVERHVLSQHS
jgi:hypothetical protein